jgi:hypothetical protein
MRRHKGVTSRFSKCIHFVLHCFLWALVAVVLAGVPTSKVFADDDPMNPGINFPAFEAALKGDGVTGWVHGRLGTLAVFVFREKDFFHYAIFPMVSHVPEVKAALDTLHRHDKITIKGHILDNGAPQKHIYVTNLNVVERWDGGGGEPVPPYQYEGKVPEELRGRSEFIGKVHFAAQDGSLIVTEFKDVIVPVVGIPGRADNLYRGDKIKIRYKIQESPRRPSHLVLDAQADQPVEVIAHLKDLHGKQECREGTLVKFPKSPEVAFDVFALQNTDSDFYTLDYTLVNFEDQELFKAIREKASAAWDLHPETVVNGRNKLHNPNLHVKACGTLNVVAPSQANPQILIDSIDQLNLDYRANRL